MRNLFSSASLLLVGVILAATASAADSVYKWKDSAGHSHYSQTPPEGQKYQTISTAGNFSATTAPAPAKEAADSGAATPSPSSGLTPGQVARQKLCETARKNVQVLTNQPVVEMEVNNSGKRQRLTSAQQTQQLDNATQQVQLFCEK